MYVETLLDLGKNSKGAQSQLITHFFKPYENKTSWVRGTFYSIDAFFEETVPNLIRTTFFIGQALFNTISTLGSLLLLNLRDVRMEAAFSLNSLLKAMLTLTVAILAPLFEAARFFIRWGATVAKNTAPALPISEPIKNKEIGDDTAAPAIMKI